MAASVEQSLGKIQGIQLPNRELQQLVSQYANDTRLSFMGQDSILPFYGILFLFSKNLDRQQYSSLTGPKALPIGFLRN